MTRKRYAATAAFAMGALLLSACGGGAGATTDNDGGTARGGNLVIARSADATSLNTTTVHDNFSIFSAEQILEPLFAVSDDGKDVEPWLAKGYEMSADRLVYTVTLRDDVLFSNGQKMTAKDVKFSIDQCTKTANSGWGYINDAIKEVSVVDDHTVKFTLKYVSSPFLAVLTMFSNQIVPADYAGKSAQDFYESPIGTGPFVMGEWKKGQYLKLVKNPKYWQKGKPYLDSIQWNAVPDVNTRKLQLQGRQVHVVEAPEWSSFDSLKNTPGIVPKEFESTRIDHVAFNQTRKPFSDVHVRRAIAYAIDRQALADAVLFGHGKPANSLLTPGTPFYDKDSKAPTFDLAKAKAELAQSSVPGGFSATMLIRAGNTEQASNAQIIQASLKELGIDLKISQLESTAARQKVDALEYDMTLTGWTMDIPDPDQWTTFAVDPAGGAKSDFTGYNNPEVIALNTAARREADPKKRAEMYSKLQQLTADDSFLAYLYYSPYGYALSDKVQGFHVTPLGNYHLENVQLTK